MKITEQKTLFMEERQQKILDILKHSKTIAVPELCDYFGVSASTIRSDLRDLDEKKTTEKNARRCNSKIKG
jgi:Transcriptional regulators of sugar metabolism